MQYTVIHCILFENSQAVKYQILGSELNTVITTIKISNKMSNKKWFKNDLPQSTNDSKFGDLIILCKACF